MEDNKDFEAVTLANLWIKEHVLDIIKEINQNEIIAESGGLNLIALSEMEAIEIMRLRIDALKLMKAYILQLKDNIAQFIKKDEMERVDKKFVGIDDHEELLQNDVNQITHDNNYFLSANFQEKLDRLRKIKSALIVACGEAELLMPRKDEGRSEKKMEVEDD